MSEIQEAVNKIETKITEFKNSVSTETSSKVDELQAKLAEEVKKINDEGLKNGETLAEIKAKVEELQKKGGRFAGAEEKAVSMQSLIQDALKEKHEEIKSLSVGEAKLIMEYKGASATMLTSSHLTGDAIQSAINKVQAYGTYKFHCRNLFQIYPTATGSVNYPQSVVPKGGDGVISGTTEGDTKNLVDYQMVNVTISLPFIAGRAKVSREMLTDLPLLQAYLSGNLTEDFLRAEDTRYFNAIAGVATTGVADTGNTFCAENFIDYLVQVENAGYTATAFITTPATWGELLKTKPADFSVPGGFTISPDGTIQIMGLPVYKSPLVPAGGVFVGDWSKVGIAQTDAFNIRSTETNEDDWNRNLISFRAEARCDLMQFAPDAIVYGTC